MTKKSSKTILCIASYFKGLDFLKQAKQQKAKVILLTAEKMLDEPWPRDSIDEIHALPDVYNTRDVLNSISYLARTHAFDLIVALDDFDVEMAARLREHLRIPGMGETTARYFRDKLAMRKQALDCGIRVPEFIHVLNYARLHDFVRSVSPPWVMKPRSQASAIGIKKITSENELWQRVESLGDEQSLNLLEQFIPGDVYHVDSIISHRKILFTTFHKYTQPPMRVAHEGGIFSTCTLKRDAPERTTLRELNKRIIKDFGLRKGVTHTEFIQGNNGEFYFLETASRVGGANIAELIEAGSGINLWREWAKLELSDEKKPYKLPKVRRDHAALIISLARQEIPDTADYDDAEIHWRLQKKHHVGFILRSKNWDKLQNKIEEYRTRIKEDFHASMPALERPSN